MIQAKIDIKKSFEKNKKKWKKRIFSIVISSLNLKILWNYSKLLVFMLFCFRFTAENGMKKSVGKKWKKHVFFTFLQPKMRCTNLYTHFFVRFLTLKKFLKVEKWLAIYTARSQKTPILMQITLFVTPPKKIHTYKMKKYSKNMIKLKSNEIFHWWHKEKWRIFWRLCHW